MKKYVLRLVFGGLSARARRRHVLVTLEGGPRTRHPYVDLCLFEQNRVDFPRQVATSVDRLLRPKIADRRWMTERALSAIRRTGPAAALLLTRDLPACHLGVIEAVRFGMICTSARCFLGCF